MCGHICWKQSCILIRNCPPGPGLELPFLKCTMNNHYVQWIAETMLCEDERKILSWLTIPAGNWENAHKTLKQPINCGDAQNLQPINLKLTINIGTPLLNLRANLILPSEAWECRATFCCLKSHLSPRVNKKPRARVTMEVTLDTWNYAQ